jgi:hypothetical protein
MGLSAFSRARVSQREEMEAEAERFQEWNQRHQYGTRLQDNTYNPALQGAEGQPQPPIDEIDETPTPPDAPIDTAGGFIDRSLSSGNPKVERVRKLMQEACQKIGEKVVAGLQENTPEGEPIDLPLRIDHALDMVGRRHIADPQGEPKDIFERLDERVPDESKGSATIVIVHKTDVVSDGPTKEEMDAAYEEQEGWEDFSGLTDEQLDAEIERAKAGPVENQQSPAPAPSGSGG